MLCTGCGGDDLPEPENQNPTSTTTDNPNAPKIDEASIVYNASVRTITFKASCPEGTIVKVLLRQHTNGTEERLMPVFYNSSSRQYYINLLNLIGNSTYSFCIIGYDIEGKEAVRSTERTFTLPKDAAPNAPNTLGIKAYAPSAPDLADGYIRGNIITQDLEYSIDNGRTWTPVTTDGIISNLQSGNVLLRIAETLTTEAGRTATIVVPPFKSNTDTDGTGGNSEGLHIRRPG